MNCVAADWADVVVVVRSRCCRSMCCCVRLSIAGTRVAICDAPLSVRRIGLALRTSCSCLVT